MKPSGDWTIDHPGQDREDEEEKDVCDCCKRARPVNGLPGRRYCAQCLKWLVDQMEDDE